MSTDERQVEAPGSIGAPAQIDLTDEMALALIEAAPDALVMVDEEGDIVLVNERAEELFGRTRGELLGKSVEELVPDSYRRDHAAKRTRYRAEPMPRPMGSGLKLAALRQDGTEFPVEISLSPLHTPDGTLVMAAVRDITERIEAARFQSFASEVFASTEAVIFVKAYNDSGRPGRYLTVNRRFEELFDFTETDVVGKTDFDLFPEAVAAELRRNDEEVLDTGVPITFQEVVPSEAEDHTYVSEKLPLRNEEGTIYAVAGVASDITNLLAAEADLREARDQVGVLEDRERIARDLHDTVIQRLFALGLNLQGAGARVADPELAAKLANGVEELDTTINEIRNTIFELQAHTPVGAGLRGDLLRIVTEQAEALGFDPHLSFAGPVDSVPKRVRAELLPTVREALTNVRRHARASRVDVTIEATDAELCLRVADDGVGMGEIPARGFGIANMKKRADTLGGSCSVQGTLGSGTVVQWQTPLV